MGEPTEITMITFATYIPEPGFAWVCGRRSVEDQFCDAAEEFRACAAECQEIATHWEGEGRRQYEELARQWRVLARLAEQRCPSFR